MVEGERGMEKGEREREESGQEYITGKAVTLIVPLWTVQVKVN